MPLFRDLFFVQQLLILNTLLFWLHPTDMDKQDAPRDLSFAYSGILIKIV
jgi:hypothetical protein